MTTNLDIDAKIVRQMAALNGFDLSLERAEAVVPILRALLEVDAQIAELGLETLPVVGLPWTQGGTDDDQQQ